jgi:galactokinase
MQEPEICLGRMSDCFAKAFGRPPDVVAFAPGRVEFIGNHTDYNGGPVLGAAIDRGIGVALALRADGRRRFISSVHSAAAAVVEVPASEVAKQSSAGAWANYPLGVLAALPIFGLKAPAGFDFMARSNLPAGSGLSSSAALELASAMAFLEATGQEYTKAQLAKIGRHAENHFVGVPCGILDQGVSSFGHADHLVQIDGQQENFTTIPMPEDVRLWVFNTHTKHALVDGLYEQRHQECMQAARLLGVTHLAEITSEQLGLAEDSLPKVAARRARHVVGETERVQAVIRALGRGDLAQVGGLLTASHRSSQFQFENSTAELDFLVTTLIAVPHVYGARLSGGGFGGAVLAMTDSAISPSDASGVSTAYLRQFGKEPEVLALRVGNGAQVLHRRNQP